ncbi:MAG: LysR family transcriptional regulator, partial [Sphingomonadales bacterium]|nr:LysR family transcriptional regulator [Sphingomonadales bacterium]
MSELNVGRYDLNLLRALLAMIETGSVTQAAQIVSVSQPAMSRILARLREDFDDPLLV